MAVYPPKSKRIAYGNVARALVSAGTTVIAPMPGRTITVTGGWLRAIGGAVETTDGIDLVDTFLHKAADATTLAATVPAVSEAESYALSIELIADHNTHTASTAYHKAATAAVTSTAATTEATLVAQVNKIRTAQLAHYSDSVSHGGIDDVTNYDLVAATTAATDAASAIILENLLVQYHAAHIIVTTGYSTVFCGWTTAGLTQNSIVRAGTATTAPGTNLLATTDGADGLKLVKNAADIATATSIDYCIKYVIS
jgi:hypothetical protein